MFEDSTSLTSEHKRVLPEFAPAFSHVSTRAVSTAAMPSADAGINGAEGDQDNGGDEEVGGPALARQGSGKRKGRPVARVRPPGQLQWKSSLFSRSILVRRSR